MVHLLEAMHKCCLPSGVPSESPSAYEKSLVHKIFGGLFRSQVTFFLLPFEHNDKVGKQKLFSFKKHPELGVILEIL